MQIVNRNIFREECDKYFKNIKTHSLNSNIYHFGHLTDEYVRNGITEFHVKTILAGVKSLLKKTSKIKNINLINVIYSTLIKLISFKDLISKDIKPETYRMLIEDSINLYKKYPLKKQSIDYRHILGRMISLKKMNIAIKGNKNGLPKSLSAIQWSIEDQLELVNTLEHILSQYKNINKGFVYKKSKLYVKDEFSYNSTKQNYYGNIIELLRMLSNGIKKMLINSENNKEDISYYEDLIYYYANKIPYNEDARMAKLYDIKSELMAMKKRK